MLTGLTPSATRRGTVSRNEVIFRKAGRWLGGVSGTNARRATDTVKREKSDVMQERKKRKKARRAVVRRLKWRIMLKLLLVELWRGGADVRLLHMNTQSTERGMNAGSSQLLIQHEETGTPNKERSSVPTSPELELFDYELAFAAATAAFCCFAFLSAAAFLRLSSADPDNNPFPAA